mgnify:CR=1 FL=1
MKCDYKKVIQLIENGDWDTAHQMVQVHSDRLSCLLHGYLHRDEGDLGNAADGYRRGGEGLADGRIRTIRFLIT